jgi:hypothetical protein
MKDKLKKANLAKNTLHCAITLAHSTLLNKYTNFYHLKLKRMVEVKDFM